MRRVVFLAVMLSGCADSKQCESFAEHLADVVVHEKEEPVDADMRAKMVKQTVDACVADPPSKEALDCALAAESSEAMKQCDAE